MEQRSKALVALLGMTALIASGCAATETVRTEAPATVMVKSTPPKPVVPQPDVTVPEPPPALQVKAPEAPAAERPPAIIVLPASNGNVTFPHDAHQQLLKECGSCHATGPGKITTLGKEWAHTTCKGCHSSMKAGPTACKDCHRK
jgi:hypothetical protein